MDHDKLADVGAGASWVLFLSSHALEWMPILQALSLVVAIIAGIFAIVVHLKRLMR